VAPVSLSAQKNLTVIASGGFRMFIPTEWFLASALVAIYICDSAHFLYIGEAVIATRIGSLRLLSFGSSFEVGGRRPYLPNPFVPWWPELRVQWDMSGLSRTAPEQVAAEMKSRLRALEPIGWLSSACMVLIVIVAPIALVTGQERAFVTAAFLCFVIAAVACFVLLRRRSVLGLSVWQAISLIAVAMVCLPCSGNLARAAANQRCWTLPASELPSLGFDAARIPGIERELRDLLARTQRLLSEDSAEYRLVGAQLKLVEERLNERH
jgi:hypothetical protein